jgi:hypothetical protein
MENVQHGELWPKVKTSSAVAEQRQLQHTIAMHTSRCLSMDNASPVTHEGLHRAAVAKQLAPASQPSLGAALPAAWQHRHPPMTEAPFVFVPRYIHPPRKCTCTSCLHRPTCSQSSAQEHAIPASSFFILPLACPLPHEQCLNLSPCSQSQAHS